MPVKEVLKKIRIDNDNLNIADQPLECANEFNKYFLNKDRDLVESVPDIYSLNHMSALKNSGRFLDNLTLLHNKM